MHTRVNVRPEPAQPIIPPTAFAYFAEQLATALAPHRTAELKQQNDCHRIDCVSVPDEVWAALDCAHPDRPVSPSELAVLIAPLMAIGDWRFCKCYRHGATAQHRFLYRLIDTVQANVAADVREIAYRSVVFVQGGR